MGDHLARKFGDPGAGWLSLRGDNGPAFVPTEAAQDLL
jgi:hypothetical protein